MRKCKSLTEIDSLWPFPHLLLLLLYVTKASEVEIGSIKVWSMSDREETLSAVTERSPNDMRV